MLNGLEGAIDLATFIWISPQIHVFIDICAKLKRITREGDIHSLSLTLNERFPTSDDNKSKVKSVDKGW